ncbi:peptidase inhibitor family I36 protein [Lentzea alba]
MCTTGQFCTWDSPEGTGKPSFAMRKGANNLADVKVDGGGDYNNRISSVHNLSGKVFCLYEHLGGKGRSLPISKGYRSVIPAKYNFNNITTSVGPADSTGKCDGTVPGEG